MGKGGGWEMHVAEAKKTAKGGWSAGVAVLAPRDVPPGIKEDCKVDPAPIEAKGRIALGRVQQGAPGGIMV